MEYISRFLVIRGANILFQQWQSLGALHFGPIAAFCRQESSAKKVACWQSQWTIWWVWTRPRSSLLLVVCRSPLSLSIPMMPHGQNTPVVRVDGVGCQKRWLEVMFALWQFSWQAGKTFDVQFLNIQGVMTSIESAVTFDQRDFKPWFGAVRCS